MNRQWWEEIPDEDTLWQRLVGGREDKLKTIEEAAVILEDIPYGDRALEIGCGNGRLTRLCWQNFEQMYGVDYARNLIEHGLRIHYDLDGLYLIHSDGLTLPFDNDYFDFIYSYTVFQHMPTRAIVVKNIREAYRVLKPEGLIRIQTVDGETDGRPYSRAEFVEEFIRCGFTILSVVTGLTHPKHVWVTARK